MKKLIFIMLGILIGQNGDAHSISSQERGAILFMNYCSGCHTLQYVSWPNMLNDLNLNAATTVQINPSYKQSLPNLASTWPHNALTIADAKNWFGKIPPDLSLISHQRGSRWIQRYLQGFYPDAKQRFGVNNHILPQSNMPYVLEQLEQELTPQEFTNIIQDIIAFLDYAADPTHAQRKKIGYGVVGFLILLSGLFWLRFRLNYKN